MAASEMWDFLSVVTPDYGTITLDVSPQGVLVEDGDKNVVIHESEDSTEERILLATAPVFYVNFPWNGLSESDAGTVHEFYFNASKASGRSRSFKWQHKDGHIYVVRFDTSLKRSMLKSSGPFAYSDIRLKVLGRAA